MQSYSLRGTSLLTHSNQTSLHFINRHNKHESCQLKRRESLSVEGNDVGAVGQRLLEPDFRESRGIGNRYAGGADEGSQCEIPETALAK